MSCWYSRRGRSPIRARTRHLVVAGVGATLLVGLLAAGAANVASAPGGAGSSSHSVIVVQRDATVAIGVSNTARSHRLVVAGAFFASTGLAAIAAARMAARRRHSPRHRGGILGVRLRAPPVLLVFAH
jgi:hypothetical protein